MKIAAHALIPMKRLSSKRLASSSRMVHGRHFSENKLRDGMLRALEKRPVETRDVERTIRSLLREICSVEDAEIPSSLLGEWVMRELSKLDQVAYVRFASVYRQFDEVQEFLDVIERLERDAAGDGDKRQISLLDPNRK